MDGKGKRNVTILGQVDVGRARNNGYMAEWEYYDFDKRRKVIERKWPEKPSEIDEFRESLKNIEFIDFNGKLEGQTRILTGFRVYKGDEIVFDRYCQFSELSTLNMLFMKVSQLK